jgi:hypothetical protein
MSNEILYLIIFIICILIIKKACNVCFKNMIFYIIIVFTIIYLINYINFDYKLKESFSTSTNNLCKIVKDNFNNIINNTTIKCIKDENKDSKQQINNGIDCYNFTGNEIVTKNNVSSWCDLNSIDIDIIDKAIKQI